MKVYNALSKVISDLEIEKIFGVPGGIIEPFLNGVSEEKNIEIISAASENQAAYMAQTYGHEKKQIGVCFCISEAGQTNIINGLSSAYSESKPLLVISGSSSSKNECKYPAQDPTNNGVNSFEMLNHCTVYNEKVTSSEHFYDKINQAINYATRFKKPVHLQFSNDCFYQNIDYQNLKIKTQNKFISKEKYIKNIIKNKKVNFLIGKDCYKISKEIEMLSLIYNINLIEIPTGKGIINPKHINYKGVFGIAGNLEDHFLTDSHYNIFIGDVLSEVNTKGWSNSLINDKLIYITENIMLSAPPYKDIETILTDIELLFKNIAKNLKIDKKSIKLKKTTEKKYLEITNKKNEHRVNPIDLFKNFSKFSDENTIAFFDVGNSFLWGINLWESKKIKHEKIQKFRIGINFGSMGWALGSSIGAAHALKNKKIICFIGDGSILMSSQEILMLNKNLNITFVLLNDSSYGTVYHGQNLSGSKSVCNTLPEIDFYKLYKNQDIKSFKIENNKDMYKINDILKQKKITIVDVRIDKEIPPPIGDRIKTLKD